MDCSGAAEQTRVYPSCTGAQRQEEPGNSGYAATNLCSQSTYRTDSTVYVQRWPGPVPSIFVGLFYFLEVLDCPSLISNERPMLFIRADERGHWFGCFLMSYGNILVEKSEAP